MMLIKYVLVLQLLAAPLAWSCVKIPPRIDGEFFNSSGLEKVGDKKAFNRWTAVVSKIEEDQGCHTATVIDIFDEKKKKKGAIVESTYKYMKDGVCTFSPPPRTRGIVAAAPEPPKEAGKGELLPPMGCGGATRVILAP